MSAMDFSAMIVLSTAWPSLQTFGTGYETGFVAPKNASLPLNPTRQAVAPVCSTSVPNWLKNGPCRPM
jgi:hypothetical protein